MSFPSSHAPFSLEFRVDPELKTGISPSTSGIFQGPVGLPSRGKVKADRTFQVSPHPVPDKVGIYAFNIIEGDDLFPKRYIGKASSLRSRFGDYLEMVRRLLALHAGYEVWTDGNGFRYVHFEIANALLGDRNVIFEYYVPNGVSTPQALARLEQLEIAAEVMRYHDAGHYDFRLLNAMDNVRSLVHVLPSPTWQAVQRIL